PFCSTLRRAARVWSLLLAVLFLMLSIKNLVRNHEFSSFVLRKFWLQMAYFPDTWADEWRHSATGSKNVGRRSVGLWTTWQRRLALAKASSQISKTTSRQTLGSTICG